MPPLVEGLWNRGKQYVQSWTRTNDKSGETAHDSDADDPACDDPDIEEIPDPNTKKRKVIAGVTVSRKRPDTRSGHEKRLQGDYELPPDAVPLVMPGSFDGAAEDFKASARMSRSKPGAGGGAFKPLNTLGRDRLRGGTARASPDTPRPGARVVGKRENEGDTIMTHQRTAGNGRNGNVFGRVDLGAQQQAKRRKLEQSAWRDLASDPIDDEDSNGGRITSVRRVPNNQAKATTNYARPQGMLDSSRTAPFEGNEARNVDDRLRMDKHKSRRKNANGYASSQDSSRPPSSLAVNGQSRKPAEPAPEIVNLIDDDTSQEISQHHAKQASLNASQELPDPKLLSRGVLDDTDGLKVRRESENSVEWSHTNARSTKPASAVNGKNRSTERQISPPVRRSIKQDDDYGRVNKNSPAKEHDQTKKTRLSRTFVRDDSATDQRVNGTKKRKDAMQADSGQAQLNGGSTRDSLGSVDELCGEKTVGSVSPEKHTARMTDAGTEVNGARSSRSRSPSDLRPSQFTSTKANVPAGGRAKARTKTTSDDRDVKVAVRLEQFLSASSYLTEGDIVMRYDPRANDLTIEHDGMVVPVPDGKRAVQITEAEASHVHLDAKTHLVLVKGSITQVSKGSICILFKDMAGKVWFVSRLQQVCSVGPEFIDRSPDEMLKLYENQAGQIGRAHKKLKEVAEREKELRDRLDAKKARKAQRSPDEDTLNQVSHTGSSDQRHRRRDMIGNDITTDPALHSRAPLPNAFERSRYFDNDTSRRSTRQSKPVNRTSSPPEPTRSKWTRVNKPDRWPHSVVYPNAGARRVTVDFQDLERLDAEEFLNDNVISFALRQIEESMAPEHKKRVHFFNSFFYTALTTKNGKKAFNYDAVKRWTKDKDLFGCDYIVVPINIDLHWFLAIICNLPNLSRRAAGDVDEETKVEGEEEAGEQLQQPSSDPTEPPSAAEVEHSAGETSETKGMRHLSLSDDAGISSSKPSREEENSALALGTQASDDAEATQTTARRTAVPAGRKSKKRRPPSYSADKPAVITLDSFGTSHTAEIRMLKEYLIAEADSKRGMSVEVDQLQGANIKDDGIPTQKNFWDCGLYLVGYVEQFAKDPRAFVSKALERTLGKQGEFQDFDADSKRDAIREELLKLQKEQEAEHKAKKAGKKAAAVKTDEQSGASAAASPKPESKPTSKSASPARDASEAKCVPAVQRQQRRAAAWEPADKPGAGAQARDAQDDELEYEAPRAYQGRSRQAHSSPQPAQPAQSDGTSEEMLDDPQPAHRSDQTPEENHTKPNPLLDNLADVLRRNSQQSEHQSHQAQRQFDDELREAAAQGSPSPVREQDEDDEDDDGPDVVRNQDVIDLGDEEDEVEMSAEIPDSQERVRSQSQSQSQGRRAGQKWAGKRKVFD